MSSTTTHHPARTRLGARFTAIGAAAAAVAAIAILGVASVVTYFSTFAPAFFYRSDPLTLSRLLPFQLEMYRQQTQILPPHTYQSGWWTWPLDIRPIWYLY